MGGGLGALGARTRTPRKIWINFGAPPRVAPLTSPPGAPQRQLSVTGTDRTLDCPCVTWIWSLERGRSVRGYPTHAPDPLSSFGHAVWRFLKVAPVGRYAAHDLSDGIGADSCPCTFHWLQYLLGQPRLSKNFSRGASRGPLRVRRRAELQASFSRPHRVSECHGQRRCVALAVGFPAHQPVALGHAMAPS